MKMGEARIEIFCGNAAAPGSSVGLLGQEVFPVAGGIVIVEFMGRELFPGGAEEIVLLGRQGHIAKAGELARIVSSAGQKAHHGSALQLLLQVQETAAFGDAGQSRFQGLTDAILHGLVFGKTFRIELRIAAA